MEVSKAGPYVVLKCTQKEALDVINGLVGEAGRYLDAAREKREDAEELRIQVARLQKMISEISAKIW